MSATSSMPRIAVVVSRFNAEVTDGLLEGARTALEEAGCALTDDDVYDAPGAFELPLIAVTLAKAGQYDGVVCLGCVVKGETAHFEFISLGATVGLMMGALQTDTPISFGVLTTYDDAQSAARSQPGPENKGHEAALACLETIRRLERIRGDVPEPRPALSSS